jgi:hypothetical protein
MRSIELVVCLLLVGCEAGFDSDELAQEVAETTACSDLTADEQAVINNMESTKAALETALGHDSFFVRQCASDTLKNKACTAAVGQGNYAQVGGWLGDLATNSGDAEVRSRAGDLAPLFITESLELKRFDYKVQWWEDPFPPSVFVFAHVVVCTGCLVTTYRGNDPEPMDVQFAAPRSPDACGRGEVGAARATDIVFTGEANTSYETQIACTSSNPGTLNDSIYPTVGAPP